MARVESEAFGPGDAVVILCALPEGFDVSGLAEELVNRSLAACVQFGPIVTSIYRWRDAVEKGSERLVLIKTRSTLFTEVEAVIRSRHPYDVPEILALPVSAGHAPYLAWIAETARGAPGR